MLAQPAAGWAIVGRHGRRAAAGAKFHRRAAPLFEREAALRGGGLDETLWYTADWDFWLRLAAKGTTVYHPEVLAAFRVHPLSQTARGVARDGEMRQQIENALAKHLPAWEAAHPGRKDVSQAAHMSLEVNHALAGCAHGRVPNLLSLTRHGLAVGRAGWYRFLRDSRIVERVAARLKAQNRRLIRGDHTCCIVTCSLDDTPASAAQVASMSSAWRHRLPRRHRLGNPASAARELP